MRSLYVRVLLLEATCHAAEVACATVSEVSKASIEAVGSFSSVTCKSSSCRPVDTVFGMSFCAARNTIVENVSLFPVVQLTRSLSSAVRHRFNIVRDTIVTEMLSSLSVVPIVQERLSHLPAMVAREPIKIGYDIKLVCQHRMMLKMRYLPGGAMYIKSELRSQYKKISLRRVLRRLPDWHKSKG